MTIEYHLFLEASDGTLQGHWASAWKHKDESHEHLTQVFGRTSDDRHLDDLPLQLSLAFDPEGKQHHFELGGGPARRHGGKNIKLGAPVQWNEWVAVKIEIRVSHEEDGFVKVWIDGQPVADLKGPTLSKERSVQTYTKFGIYGDNPVEKHVAFFDEIRIASRKVETASDDDISTPEAGALAFSRPDSLFRITKGSSHRLPILNNFYTDDLAPKFHYLNDLSEVLRSAKVFGFNVV